MLGELELDGLTRQLGDFRVASRQNGETLQELLQKYEEIVEDYRRLRSDYEEERESREKYKKLAKGQERNPFVLVLVDGDGYIFNEQFIRAGNDGGIKAGQALNNAVKGSLSRLGKDAEQCRIMIRVYANLHGLSKTLARANLVGAEARALAPFAAGFNRSQDLCDFVDAGDKEGTDFKIRELFRLFSDSGQCKHIFFAGCHNTGYLSLLTPYRGTDDRITLIRSSSFNTEFLSLGFHMEDFPSVFQSILIPETSKPSPSLVKPAPQPISQQTSPFEKPCKFFPMGNCKYGRQCKNSHSLGARRFNGTLSDTAPRAVDDLLTNRSESSSSPQPFSAMKFSQNTPIGPTRWDDVISLLPKPSPEYEGLIPINKDGERIDVLLPKLTNEDWALYQQRSKSHKLCNEHHLANRCRNSECGYDHSPIKQQALEVMRTILREYPCPRKGKCRRNCYNGHICQKRGCRGPGGKCKLNSHMHYVDPRVVQWVPQQDEETTDLVDDNSSGVPVSEDDGSRVLDNTSF